MGHDELKRQVRRRRAWLATAPRGRGQDRLHLERDGEPAAVQLPARPRTDPALPDLVVTFLAAHALPPV